MPLMLMLLVVLALPLPGRAAPVEQPHSRAELIAERTALEPGRTATVAVRLQLDEHWHVYWKNPGDSGMATSVSWSLPEGFQAGPIQWPAPHRIDVGPLTSYGYEGEVLHLVDIAVPRGVEPGSRVPLRARADWLVCKEICLPASADLVLELPVASGASAADARWSAAFAAARAALPVAQSQLKLAAYRSADQLIVRVTHADGMPVVRELDFFADHEGLIQYAAAQRLTRHAGGYDLTLAAVSPDAATLAGVLVAQPSLGGARAIEVQLPVQAGPPPAMAAARTSGLALAGALALAFGGGLLLNLMPCVFPVLAIKVLGVAQQARGHSAALRAHGLLFALGVLISFWLIAGLLLGLRAQGTALGWGYQLQSPLVVGGLALLFFVLALNLSGVFQVGTSVQKLAGSARLHNPHADALLSGALATAVASPCTAPFMGAALGFALVQPALDAMLVFTALALGMAVPYVVFCFVPRLTRRLPRPGPWMETLRQLLAFPLYATVAWLLWVLGQQSGMDAMARMLFALVLVAAGLWAWSRSGPARRGGRLAARVIAAGLLVGSVALGWPGIRDAAPVLTAATDAWQPWSDHAVAAALTEGRPVFVDFTAAWCVTCQVNKRLVLQAGEVARRFDELGVVRLRADWTNRDPAITAALSRLDRIGVPVYALYLPAQPQPQLLPEILTRRLVLDALEQAARFSTASASTNPRLVRQEQP